MIKLEMLRAFVAVAEAGNIKDAADRMCRTASALSMTLKQLETELGGPLFETDRKNSLTALGAFMLETAQLQINSYDRAIDRIQAYAQNRIGALTLASVPSVAANIIPRLLPRFVEQRPGIQIEMFDMDSRNVRAMVEAGLADIGIAGRPPANAPISFEPLFRDRFKVVCSAKSDLAQRNSAVGWEDLQDETVILNGSSENIASPGYRDLSSKATITVRNVMSLLALAKSDFGITLLPALALADLPEGIVSLDLADDSADRAVGLLSRADSRPSPVAAAFRQFLVAETPKLTVNMGFK